jgi:hypothetical protein
MAAAWIGFAGGVCAAILSAFVAVRQSRMDERLAHVNHELDLQAHRSEALFDRDLQAQDVLARYREPLAAAAFDLQSRLYNILRLDFFDKFGGDQARGEEALRTTVFRLAQYFGWTEILRREIQFLSFPKNEDTRRVAGLQSAIAKCFLTDEHGHALMIWSDEQRGIGERMIVAEQDQVICMGYASFRERCEDTFSDWCARVRTEVTEPAALDRLRHAQHLLCDLVDALDPDHVRYAGDLERA